MSGDHCWLRRLVPALVFAACLVWGTSEESVRPVAASQAGGKSLPKFILVIRHAEKPEKEAGDVHLSPAGKERAERLHHLFEKSDKRPDPFPVPEFIFATHNGENSHRPVETVTPLAHKLKLTINEDFHNTLNAVVKKGKTAKGINNLRDDLFGAGKFAGKTVLICWHHGTIPELAHALKATQAPDKWKSEVFDRVWQISYNERGEAVFADRPQQLMPGDSAK